jgi:hypothetical protein
MELSNTATAARDAPKDKDTLVSRSQKSRNNPPFRLGLYWFLKTQANVWTLSISMICPTLETKGWASTYNMLKKYLKLEPSIRGIIRNDQRILELQPNAIETTNIEEF